MNLDFCCNIQMEGSQFDINNMNGSILVSISKTGGSVMVWGHTWGVLLQIDITFPTLYYHNVLIV